MKPFAAVRALITRFLKDDRGQDLIEYAFLAIFIVLVCALALGAIGTNINTKFDNIGTQISSGS